ncbi:hypothetical protein FQZ97_378680 [compost metagenome]
MTHAPTHHAPTHHAPTHSPNDSATIQVAIANLCGLPVNATATTAAAFGEAIRHNWQIIDAQRELAAGVTVH